MAPENIYLLGFSAQRNRTRFLSFSKHIPKDNACSAARLEDDISWGNMESFRKEYERHSCRDPLFIRGLSHIKLSFVVLSGK